MPCRLGWKTRRYLRFLSGESRCRSASQRWNKTLCEVYGHIESVVSALAAMENKTRLSGFTESSGTWLAEGVGARNFRTLKGA